MDEDRDSRRELATCVTSPSFQKMARLDEAVALSELISTDQAGRSGGFDVLLRPE